MSDALPQLIDEAAATFQNKIRSQQKNPKKSSRAAADPNIRTKKNVAPPVPQRAPLSYPQASFSIVSPFIPQSNKSAKQSSTFSPRLGKLVLTRSKAPSWNHVSGTSTDIPDPESKDEIVIETPGMLCGASRGIVRHLSRDMVAIAKGVEWIHIPFEDFLEHNAPVPALHPAPLPLHTYLNHPTTRHILSISLRDPGNNQQMPANTNAYVQAKTVRGVRKVTIDDWIAWCNAVRPDIIWAFVDTPKTLLIDNDDVEAAAAELIPGEGRQTSQKRTTKSLERSVGWLEKAMAGLRKGQQSQPGQADEVEQPERPPIIVPLMGGCDRRARAEFAHNLTEKLDQNDQKKTGLHRLDEGIFGYAIETVDLPINQYHTPPATSPITSIELEDEYESSDSEPDPESESTSEVPPRQSTNKLTGLVKASLKSLSPHKPRIAHSTPSPHAVLRLVLECGIDLFDPVWAQQASDYGIALIFEFPVPPISFSQDSKGKAKDPDTSSKKQIGVNLFEDRYAEDISPLGDIQTSWPCAPTSDPRPVLHSSLDDQQWSQSTETFQPSKPFTRAYIHHLLRTHEMSSHVLLQLHNLAIADRFFHNIRALLASCESDEDRDSKFRAEVIRFYNTYDIPTTLYEEARTQWKEVDTSRGKGRLKREREAAATAAEAEATAHVAEGGGIVAQAVVAEALEDVS